MTPVENNITKGTIIRTIILIVALVNQILTSTGHAVLPFSDEAITEVVSVIFTIVVSAIAWWKNNSFTKEARAADKMMIAMKEDSKQLKEIQNGQ